MASRATSLVTSTPFSSAPSCSAIFGGLLGRGGTLLGLPFLGFATSGGAFVLELFEEEAWMAGG